MTLFGIGIDIFKLNRMKKIFFKPLWKNFQKRIFHPAELTLNKKKNYKYFATIFTIKEAFLKALGIGWSESAHFNEIEVQYNKFNHARIKLHGSTKQFAWKLKIKKMLIDFSIDGDYVISVVGLVR
ncbi:MAG: holo-ACP synthase [Candidatus Firestonebacteria bacterium]